MITFILIAMGVLILVGVVYLVMASGTKGGRDGQSANSVVREQKMNSNPRGDVRGTGSAND